MLSINRLGGNGLRLLDVDCRVNLPVFFNLKLLLTSNDVLHS